MIDQAQSAELLAQTTKRQRGFARRFFRIFSLYGIGIGVAVGCGVAYYWTPSHSLRDIFSDVGEWSPHFFMCILAFWLFFGLGIGGAVRPFIERDLWRVRRLLKTGTLYPAAVTKHLMSGTRVHFVSLAWTVDGRPRTLDVALRDIDSADVKLQGQMQVLDDGKRAAMVLAGHGLFLAS